MAPPLSRAPVRRRGRLLVTAAVAAASALLVAAIPALARDTGNDDARKSTVDVQMLSFNDFHGTLEAPQGASGLVQELQPDGSTKAVKTGGVAHLAAQLRAARKGHPYSVTAAAGDVVGGSPLLSGLFHDEPTIEAMNRLGLDVSALGEHEFDEGVGELKRLQHGGCHPEDGCHGPDGTFRGADFSYLAANVIDDRTGRPVMRPYTIWQHHGVRVGFIGVTLAGAPGLVPSDSVRGLTFQDETKSINKYAKELESKGVHAIVALVHEGGVPWGTTYNYDCDGFGSVPGLSGPIVQLAKNVSPAVDAFVTGHTHQSYTCTIPDPSGAPRTVTSAASYGKLYTETTLDYDRSTGDFVRTETHAANHAVPRNGPAAADVDRLVKCWKSLAAPVANRPVGWVAEDVNGTGSRRPDTPLGDLVADAQLAAAREQDPETDLALADSRRIRSDLVYKAAGAEGDGVVTYGEAYTAQPFGDSVQLVDLTGAQLLQTLREQVSGTNAMFPHLLQVSEGVHFTVDLGRSGADRLVAESVKIDGKPLDTAATYRVALSSYLAEGKSGFPSLADGKQTGKAGGDLDVLQDYLAEHSSPQAPLTAPAAGRITLKQ